jgi:FKBP-type peptidyl-prolyl cis-trans isomerase
MSTFEHSLTAKEGATVSVPEGKVMNVTSVALTLKRKGKGTTNVTAKRGEGKAEVIATFPNAELSTHINVKVSFPTSGEIEFSLSGAGTAVVRGSVDDIATKTNKKRKAADSTSADADVQVSKEVKHGVPRIFDIKKAWNAKPLDDEGVVVTNPKPVYKEKDLKCIDYVVGNGPYPKAGAPVKINYVGLLQDGTVFDSRVKRKEPLVFRKGVHQVVRGLDLGMEGMKIGGAREITVPPEFG